MKKRGRVNYDMTSGTRMLRVPALFLAMAGALMLATFVARANNIAVTKVGLIKQNKAEKTAYVTFTLSWDNSWQNGANRDAAWVFVKFKAPGSNVWEHAILSANNDAHRPGASSVIAAVPDGGGVFIYGAANHTGSVTYVRSQLCWEYGSNGYDFAVGALIDVSVHAIEMVYVPEDPFFAGSGGNEHVHFFEWTDGISSVKPYLISSESAITWGMSPGNMYYSGIPDSGQTLPGDTGGIISNAFPKGYSAFYCMKYELSAAQYTDFLNKLTPTQANNNKPWNYGSLVTYGYQRYSIITNVDLTFSTDAPDRAQNWMQVAFGEAYSDWAALRPMTELEYEKACRGPANPVPNEYAWGTTYAVVRTGYAGVDGSGTETALPTNANYSLLNATPSRVGIFAASNSTRAASGASYYGVLDMSGNLVEQVVTVGYTKGRSYTGLHGDGTLATAGTANVSGWPGESGGQGTIKRGAGGCVGQDAPIRYMPVSARGAAYSNGDRCYNSGWRAVRTAP